MINRREFMTAMAGGVISSMIGKIAETSVSKKTLKDKTNVSLVRTSDRASGIRRAVEILNLNPVKGSDVLLKPNFNTADPFPGSTHNDTLISLILQLKNMGAKSITVGERSGPPDTSVVLKEKGIIKGTVLYFLILFLLWLPFAN